MSFGEIIPIFGHETKKWEINGQPPPKLGFLERELK
jgi:hypothetical protein